MRMWNVETGLLCRNHLLGEHLEVHLFVGSILKDKSLNGYLNKGLLEVHNLTKRHNEIVKELKKRGYKHNSKLPKFKSFKAGNINIEENVKELCFRCVKCRERYLRHRYYRRLFKKGRLA